MKYRNILNLNALLVLWLAACGGGGSSTKVTLNDANTQFAAGTFQAALDSYLQLIASEGSVARVGAGWCYIRLNDYINADAQFSAAAADNLADGYAGWSFTAWHNSQSQQVVDRVTFVLTASPTYVFSLDSRITKNSLIYVRASSYLQLLNYSACLTDIKVLDSGYAYVLTGNSIADANELLAKLQALGVAA